MQMNFVVEGEPTPETYQRVLSHVGAWLKENEGFGERLVHTITLFGPEVGTQVMKDEELQAEPIACWDEREPGYGFSQYLYSVVGGDGIYCD